MRLRRLAANAAGSLWLHLSLLVLAGVDVSELWQPEEETTGDTTSAEGSNVDIDGVDPEGEATAELQPVAVTVFFEEETPPTPAPVDPLPPDPAATEPPAPVAAAPATSTDPNAPNVGAADPTAAPADKTGPQARPVRPARPSGTPMSATRRRTQGPPCDPAPEEIEKIDDVTWAVERSFIEYYATHLKELYAQGSVWTHKGPDGKPDGFRMGLSRCSVVKHAGFRNGDVVNRINGRKIATIPGAIAAYFDLRNEEELEVQVTRQGKPVTLYFQLDQGGQKRSKARRGEFKELRHNAREGVSTPAPAPKAAPAPKVAPAPPPAPAAPKAAPPPPAEERRKRRDR